MNAPALPGKTPSTPRLLVDVGGTGTRCALQRRGGPAYGLGVFRNDDHPSLARILERYLADCGERAAVERAALAVAAPVEAGSGAVSMTNRNWRFSSHDLAAALGLSEVRIVNDFTANALSIPHLGPADRFEIGDANAEPAGPCAILGPGTGLGVSGLLPAAEGGWVPIAGEGGHVTLAPANPQESRLLDVVRDEYGHVSAERLLSGGGLAVLYRALTHVLDVARPTPEPHEIAPLAARGDALAQAALMHFFSMLGTVAGNLALTLGATGGVYLAGGILPRLREELVVSGFRARFEQKGRYREYLQRIPTYLITTEYPALLGLASTLDTTPSQEPCKS
ncbi:MAG: glucokinase [Planctomycetota bacterium]